MRTRVRAQHRSAPTCPGEYTYCDPSWSCPPDQRDPLARLDLQREIVQQRQMPVGHGDVVENDERHLGTVPHGLRPSRQPPTASL